MNQQSLIVALILLASSTCRGEAQSEPITIPLDRIWAYDMPGTLDAHKLDSGAHGTKFMQIRKSLWPFPKKDQDAREGFAVPGNGSQALTEAHVVLVENKKSQSTFPIGTDISVVFFANQSTYYVYLDGVRRQGNTIEIRYRFVPHETEDTTEHFALIPLGELPSGTYHVKIIQNPMDRTNVGSEFPNVSEKNARQIVCRSFSFSVKEQGE